MKKVNICWLRRDLRFHDNAALYHALRSGTPVVLLFIFDTVILDKLENKSDARVTFIYEELEKLHKQAKELGSGILIGHGRPEAVWKRLLKEWDIESVYINTDYEPDATKRDEQITKLLTAEKITLHTYKDQVIFEKNEVIKGDGTPYTVFTPYFKQWLNKLNDFYRKAYPSEKKLDGLHRHRFPAFPTLGSLGFKKADTDFPSRDFEKHLSGYEKYRDFPAQDATTHIGIHLRFGTVSIRHAVQAAEKAKAGKWLSELAWRDFYMMIVWHFPYSARDSFKPAYDHIRWRNNDEEFDRWCKGTTGYPLVDAGMRQLNTTGWMHNRVRMVVASFLSKHLLIDWRWGEAYFAGKLLDYELSSNVGGWQWAAGSGNDAAPYFRVFNPEAQMEKFDKDKVYIKKWVPEYGTDKYVKPMVEHTFARIRVLEAYKKALDRKD